MWNIKARRDAMNGMMEAKEEDCFDKRVFSTIFFSEGRPVFFIPRYISIFLFADQF